MSKETITKALSVILAFLLCVSVFAIFAKFTSNFSEGFKTFYVTYDGKDIFAQESQMYLAQGEEHVFDVTYTFEFLDEGEKVNTDYDVKIVPNIEKNTDFNFMVDGNKYAYSSVADLSQAFEIEKNDNSFTLMIPEKTTIQSVLESVYGKMVDVPANVDSINPRPYTLVISSYNKSVVYKIDFGVQGWIDLDKPWIVF